MLTSKLGHLASGEVYEDLGLSDSVRTPDNCVYERHSTTYGWETLEDEIADQEEKLRLLYEDRWLAIKRDFLNWKPAS